MKDLMKNPLFSYAIIAIIITIAVVTLKKTVGDAVGSGIEEDKDQGKSDAENLIDDLNKETQGVATTQSAAIAQANANTIYESLKYSAVADNKDAALAVLKTVNNNADVAQLITKYGVKQHYFFGLNDGAPKDLIKVINSESSIVTGKHRHYY